ncbi:MAG: 1-(5-phosphoribosyl)-5-[(5-phosphoribosylamino)methylideneamino]imidazole-4-carboxamide isomerase [Chitinophagia bacterium]|nr:1-(5-phosphoribosyl)-5-[(5-phosphoribosylamino)methylideneamino]imidazole-4-carboxamide isomerase [Chitinophagia bacterium]
MQIIPAIDIIGGKCVRLTQGDYAQETVYSQYPWEMAKSFEDIGLQRLHLVDLDGAKAGSIQNLRVLEKIAAVTRLKIDFGGGIHSQEAVQSVIDAGATWVTIGSVAVKAKEKVIGWMDSFGSDKFIVGADVKGTRLAVAGWTETTDQEIMPFLEYWSSKGIQQVFCTDISKDGKLSGPSLPLYQSIVAQFPELFFIASGGVSDISDLHDLQGIGCDAAIVGKAIYEKRISLQQLKEWKA